MGVPNGLVMELVDLLVLETSAERRGGSSPPLPTMGVRQRRRVAADCKSVLYELVGSNPITPTINKFNTSQEEKIGEYKKCL